MVFDFQSVAYYITWVVTTTFFVALIPQVLLNYKLKSTAGLSDAMILIYFAAYAMEVSYAYLLNLPLSYRTMMPGGLLAVTVIVVQRLYYVPFHSSKKFINVFYYILSAIGLVLLVAFYDQTTAGRIAGWIAMSGFTLAYIPQLVRVHMTKSVHGLSILFILMLGAACTMEFISAFLLDLPLPSLANGFRGMLVNIIFLVQFWMYKKTFIAAENPILEKTQLQ